MLPSSPRGSHAYENSCPQTWMPRPSVSPAKGESPVSVSVRKPPRSVMVSRGCQSTPIRKLAKPVRAYTPSRASLQGAQGENRYAAARWKARGRESPSLKNFKGVPMLVNVLASVNCLFTWYRLPRSKAKALALTSLMLAWISFPVNPTDRL